MRRASGASIPEESRHFVAQEQICDVQPKALCRRRGCGVVGRSTLRQHCTSTELKDCSPALSTSLEHNLLLVVYQVRKVSASRNNMICSVICTHVLPDWIMSCHVAHIQEVSVWSAPIRVAQCNSWKCACRASFSHLTLRYVHVVPKLLWRCATLRGQRRCTTTNKTLHARMGISRTGNLSRGKLK